MLSRILLLDDYKRSTSRQVQGTAENNNLPITFGSARGSNNSSSEVRFTDNTAGTKADLEQLAQNRGNAMQPYKDKRKNRRYESRKARADTKLRAKGRFVKASEAPYP